MEVAMTNPTESITVVCRSCGNRFETSWSSPVDPDRDDFDGGYVEDVSSVTCPACGTTSELSSLTDENGDLPFGRE
jgi:endogenous inhibitor of DNA gyrase (YacG/DUF329 family)